MRIEMKAGLGALVTISLYLALLGFLVYARHHHDELVCCQDVGLDLRPSP